MWWYTKMLLKELLISRAGEGRHMKTLEHLSDGGAKKEESAKQTKRMGPPVRTPNVQNCNHLNNSTKNKINMHECTVLQINDWTSKIEGGRGITLSYWKISVTNVEGMEEMSKSPSGNSKKCYSYYLQMNA